MVEAQVSSQATVEETPAGRWSRAAPRIFEALAVNAVPLWGLLHGWSLGTLLLLYWCENLLNTVFIGGRIWLHRKLTRKRGHWIVVETPKAPPTFGGRPTATPEARRTTVLAQFVQANLIFSLAHGVFVLLLVFLVLPGGPSAKDLERGVAWLAAAMMVSFALDAAKIRTWPFAWIRQRCDAAVGRLLVVHLALIGGAFLLSLTARPSSFFAVFIALKLVLDLGLALPHAALSPGRVPLWLAWARPFAKPGKVDEVWKEVASDELRKEHDDEEVLA